MIINNFKKIVIKIGSSSIVNQDSGLVKEKWLDSISSDIKKLVKKNVKITIVSSGAIALGKNKIFKNKIIRRLEEKQAAAALGQIELSKHWQESFKKNNLLTAQLLLTLDDSETRRRYLNVRKTIASLLKNKIVPMVFFIGLRR